MVTLHYAAVKWPDLRDGWSPRGSCQIVHVNSSVFKRCQRFLYHKSVDLEIWPKYLTEKKYAMKKFKIPTLA